MSSLLRDHFGGIFWSQLARQALLTLLERKPSKIHRDAFGIRFLIGFFGSTVLGEDRRHAPLLLQGRRSIALRCCQALSRTLWSHTRR